jgi:hypothetical protein
MQYIFPVQRARMLFPISKSIPFAKQGNPFSQVEDISFPSFTRDGNILLPVPVRQASNVCRINNYQNNNKIIEWLFFLSYKVLDHANEFWNFSGKFKTAALLWTMVTCL